MDTNGKKAGILSSRAPRSLGDQWLEATAKASEERQAKRVAATVELQMALARVKRFA